MDIANPALKVRKKRKRSLLIAGGAVVVIALVPSDRLPGAEEG